MSFDHAAGQNLESFIELLIEISALQRLRRVWLAEEGENSEQNERLAILSRMIRRRCAERDRELRKFSEAYPEIKTFGWLNDSNYDA